MGRTFGYLFMVLAGVALIALISDLTWMRRTGLMFGFFGREAAMMVVSIYVGAFISLMFSAWIAFTLQEMREAQDAIMDRLLGRGTGSLTGRAEPKVRREHTA